MARNKQSISGRKIAAGKYEVVDGITSKLIPGQRVLVYKPTDRNIVAASGKILGKKEQVLGAGEVKVIGNKLVVEISQSKIAYRPQAKSSMLKVAKQSIKMARPIERGQLRLSDGKVLIKAIEE